MDTPLRVLILDDSEDDALLLVRELKRGGYAPTCERADTALAMHTALAGRQWDIILSDYSMPAFSALDALELLHNVGLDLPFIVVSGTINEVMAVDVLKAGAHDFVLKGNFPRLVPAIERELREAQSRSGRRRAEERLRTTLDSLAEGAQIIGFDWRYLYVNNAVAAQGRKTTEELLGQTMMQAYPGIEQTELFARLALSMEQRATQRMENEFDYPDGSKGWFNLNIEPVPEGLFVLSQDITERKRADAQIQDQLARLAALREIDRAINASLDLKVTLNVFLGQVVTQLGVDAADVLLLEPRSQVLEYAAGRGFRSPDFQQVNQRVGEGRAGQAVLERRMVTSDLIDIRPASKRTGLLGGDAFTSYYGVPLIAKGQVLGVLEIFHRSPLQPAPEWLEFLEALSSQAAIAIDNARLFDSLQATNQELFTAYDATIEGWSRALDLRDHETEGHSQRVTELTTQLALAMSMNAQELVHVRRGALLHDIGKMGVPDRILLKPGPLTDDEWVIMRQHPTFAYQMLEPIRYLRPALEIPYCHHEKWDGTGYPRGLKADHIPLAARIFAVVDVWDALRSDRPYRRAWPEVKVREHIREQAGKHFDPAVVAAFLEMLRRGPEMSRYA
jgi:PAS domain S-box-containing protein